MAIVVHVRTQMCSSCKTPNNDLPEDTFVEILDVDTVQTIQVVYMMIQVLLELVPSDIYDLIGDVTLDHFHKVLHLMSMENTQKVGKEKEMG